MELRSSEISVKMAAPSTDIGNISAILNDIKHDAQFVNFAL